MQSYNKKMREKFDLCHSLKRFREYLFSVYLYVLMRAYKKKLVFNISFIFLQ